jgi:hypothetical protein
MEFLKSDDGYYLTGRQEKIAEFFPSSAPKEPLFTRQAA